MESVTTADVDLNTDSPLQAIKVFSFLNSQLFIDQPEHNSFFHKVHDAQLQAHALFIIKNTDCRSSILT